MSSVTTICLAYGNVYAICSRLLSFKQVQKFASVYRNVHQRMLAYLKRTRRVSNILLTFTLTYVDATRYSVTAL